MRRGVTGLGYRRVLRRIPERRVSETGEIAETTLRLRCPLFLFFNGALTNVNGDESTVYPRLIKFYE